MNEFILNNYGLIIKSVELLAAITGLIVYKKFSNSDVKYFIWFLVAVVFIENIGSYPRYLKNWNLSHLTEGLLIRRNYWWFNLFWAIGGSLFLSWYLMKVNTITYYKTIIRFLRYLFVVSCLTYILLDWKAIFLPSTIYFFIISAILVGFCSFLLFLDFLLSDKILEFHKDVNFYIASILFIWYLVTTCLDFYEVYFNEDDKDFVILKYQVFLVSNIFMYVSFSVALLWCNPQKK